MSSLQEAWQSFPQAAGDLDEYGVGDLSPSIAIAPHEASSMALALKLACQEESVCVPWGGGLQQDLGFIPSRYDGAISTRSINRVVDYQPGDLTVTVEAGMTLAELQRVLFEHNQFVPLESPEPQRETIGGLLATGRSALLRCSYGGPRDQVIGIACAMLDGNVVHGGGRVVKNVAGYDVCKLFTGSMGTLGMIVEATFKVRPLPSVRRTWIGVWETAEQSDEALAAVMESAISPSWLQAMDPGVMNALGHRFSIDLDGKLWGIGLGADGHEDLSAWMIAQAGEVAHPTRHWIMDDGKSARVRHMLIEACAPRRDLFLKLSAASSDVFPLMQQIRQRCIALGSLTPHCAAAASNGVIYLDVRCEGAAGEAAAVTLTEWANEIVEKSEGCCVVGRCAISLRRRLPMWGRSTSTRALMRQLRDRMDPRWTLNRGRLFEEEH